jgi:hypothetical protein
MAGQGGEPPPPPSPASSFRRLVEACSKQTTTLEAPSFVKKLKDIPEIDLPPDQPMKVALSLSERGLIGQFMGLWPSSRSTDNWVQRNWRPLITNSVTCYAVGRGYFIFEFISQEDRDLIFRNGPYFMGTQGLYLNRWTPNFDPASEIPKDVPVWVRLPNLPIHCWNPSSLQAIGNGLGRYIDRAEPRDQYSCARICVEVDLEVGLPEAIKLKVGTWQHIQKLDYEQLPFKCRGCHEYGHFQRNCPKALTTTEKEGDEGWQQARKGRSRARGQRREQTEPQKSKSTEAPGKENSFRILGQNTEESVQDPNEAAPEEGKEDQHLEDKGNTPIEEDGTQSNPPQQQDDHQNAEDGEIQIGSDSEEVNEIWTSPKKKGRGRKSKIDERNQEAHNAVLNGSQSTIKSTFTGHQTRKQIKASQGGHPPPPPLGS